VIGVGRKERRGNDYQKKRRKFKVDYIELKQKIKAVEHEYMKDKQETEDTIVNYLKDVILACRMEIEDCEELIDNTLKSKGASNVRFKGI
jgi:hypothetical protein